MFGVVNKILKYYDCRFSELMPDVEHSKAFVSGALSDYNDSPFFAF
jgi:hypothetical protein